MLETEICNVAPLQILPPHLDPGGEFGVDKNVVGEGMCFTHNPLLKYNVVVHAY